MQQVQRQQRDGNDPSFARCLKVTKPSLNQACEQATSLAESATRRATTYFGSDARNATSNLLQTLRQKPAQ